MKKLNKYVYHVSNPKFRNSIKNLGLLLKCGEQQCFEYSNNKLLFATNSGKQKDWFDSCFDDDVWRIESKFIKKYEKDRNYINKKHIVIFNKIPKNAIKLIYKGTGTPKWWIWQIINYLVY